ncbi:MAG TPA: FUSC family protein [Solirubrobacteraceae bacterium]|nr:FUSC family protein [Solirubrobacteraceae bacterium]
MAERSRFALRRLDGNPILHRDTTAGVGRNVNGPSLIAAPSWLERLLGRYYLYFAHHRGTFIRLATSDLLEGPWRVYEPGTLALAQSHFPTDGRRPHIASPDVHVDEASGTVRMYYHGLDTATREQHTRVAVSADGVHFQARPEPLGRPYFRVFLHDGWWYALAMPGVLYRSAWTSWRAGPAMEVLEPGEPWEGADLPLERSVRGWVDEPVRQLRDPAIFQEGERVYLLYSVAGESGIAIAELDPIGGPAGSAPAAANSSRAATRSKLAAFVATLDPGLLNMREAAVTMAATLASFATALAIEHETRLSTSVAILAVALAISLGRAGQREDHRTRGGRALAAVVLPFVAVAANEIGTRIFRQPDLGDALFVLAISATIWVRRFGPTARLIARFATFPLIAMLIVPAPIIAARGTQADGRWWAALIALVALGWVTLSRFAAERGGILEPAAAPPAASPPMTSAARPGRRVAPSTKMALQMAAALGAAFALGRSLFGTHWTWVVLTAFIVCAGNRGRGDVLHKAAMRIAGAAAGTLAATALSGAFPAGDSWSIVVIFAVLAAALWLRPVNYAFWAGGMTAALALLYGYYGRRGVGLLATRLEAILLGAALSVAASWFLLPVRTTDIIRRDLAAALAALDSYLAGLHEDPASALARQERFRGAVGALAHAGALLRAVPAPLRSRLDQLPALRALEHCARELPSVTEILVGRRPEDHWPEHLDGLRARVAELRRANGQRLLPDAPAWNRLADGVRELPRTLATPASSPRTARDGLWESSERSSPTPTASTRRRTRSSPSSPATTGP